MGRITLKSIPTIRMIENDYLADVLYYFSKDRGQSIVDNVTHLFNTSLGGIITWDILSHQREGLSAEEKAEYLKFDVNFSKLDFKPDFFFGFGSPLAAVLNMRNQSPHLYHPEWDIIFENIFHPFDPLAYRFEPLMDESYTDEAAVLVQRSIPLGPTFSFPSIPFPSSGILSFFSWRVWSQDQKQHRGDGLHEESIAETAESIERAEPIVADDNQKPQQPVADNQDDDQNQGKTFLSTVNAFLQYFSSNTPRQEISEASGKQEDGNDESEKEAQEGHQERPMKLPYGRRIDHVLQPESFMSMIANEYLVGLRAHFSYWTNKDLLWHLVRHLEDLKEATTPENIQDQDGPVKE
ncbi:DDHD domain-containing protein [Dichotomocladium elegans]|nr:DDHD domain-containing protein [Dichotomocladium elegans]